jgi:hypothetical protein
MRVFAARRIAVGGIALFWLAAAGLSSAFAQ